ncbi:secreted protein [Candidatus Magnetomorum sp. HK-1]|nr:secreted protein [Candidatus Magnetomorum sp. HK-1]
MKNFLKSVLFVLAFFFLCNASHAQETINISTGEYIPFASESLNHKALVVTLLKKPLPKKDIQLSLDFFPGKELWKIPKN